MKTELLDDLRIANQAITQFVSHLSATKASPQPESYAIQLDHVTSQVVKIEKAIASLPPPASRDANLDKELKTYAVNLGLLKKAVEDVEPILRSGARMVKEAIGRLGAARSWSESLKDLSK